jgi:CheY-like chemotaxis protein
VMDPTCKDHDLVGVRVLLVDGRADERELWSYVLEHCGAEVVVADSVKNGLETFAWFRPTILLSDISLVDGDGYALIRALRASGQGLPAIALTGHARTQDREAALAAGFDEHVAKPVEPGALVDVVASLTVRNS